MRTLAVLIASLFFAYHPATVHAQSVENSTPKRLALNKNLSDPFPDDDLKAAFLADTRSGFPPLSVTFTDLSTGEIQGWSWEFGDDQTSEEQHPVHVFENPGSYNITLTVTDGTNFYTLEKENYILVRDAPGDCDTLDYPFAGTYTYHILQPPGKGYVSGSNSYGDLAKANVFNHGEAALIVGVFVDFAVAKDVSGTNPDVKIAVWNNAGANGSPGSIIGHKMIPMAQIIDDISNDLPTWVLFDEAIIAGSNFYVGAILPGGSDTLAFWTDTHLDSPAGKGWEQWDDQTWHPYSSEQSWGLRISNAIHPVVCAVTGTRTSFPEGSVAVYPVPARNKIYISLTDQADEIKSVELFNMQGNLCFSQNYDSFRAIRSIPVHHLPAGLYFIKAISDDHVLTQKILISR